MNYLYLLIANPQIQFIKEHFCDKNMQQIEFHKLLEEEVKLLNEMEKKRNKIRKEAHERYMDRMLDKMGAPVKWIGYKSKRIFLTLTQYEIGYWNYYCFVDIRCEMDSLQCQKIRKLTKLYHQLKTPETKIDRIEFVGELHMILLEEPHSMLLEEVNKSNIACIAH